MENAHRVNLIRSLTQTMMEWAPSDAEVALEEFDIFHGRHDYYHNAEFLSRILRDASNEHLISLFDYCSNSTFELDRVLISPACWTSDDFRVFISHASSDRKMAHELRDALLSLGFRAFVAHDDIAPDIKWQVEIERALDTADAIVCICTSDSRASVWVNQEIGWGLGRRIPVYSVKAPDDPAGFTSQIQAIPSQLNQWIATARTLVGLLLNRASSHSRALEALLRALESSCSFVQTKSIAPMLESLAPWDSNVEDRIRVAIRENNQVGDCYAMLRVWNACASDGTIHAEIPF